MSTLSTFRINQPPGTPGTYDRSRRDVVLGAVEAEALEKAETSYLWEWATLPYGVSVVITGDTTHTCSFTLAERGSYLLRLTVNAGLPNQSVTTLFIGIAMANTGLVLPAMGETNQDNSQSPYDGARGYEDKANAIFRKVDAMSVAGGIEVDNASWDSILKGQTTVQGALDAIDAVSKSGEGVVYVDALNGDNTDGDGTLLNPYETLAGAVTDIGQPADQATFIKPLTFILNPGTYSDDVVLPCRQVVNIVLKGATISGKLSRDLDQTYWHGLATMSYPTMLNIRNLHGQEGVVGDIDFENVDPAAGDVGQVWFSSDSVALNGHIVVQATGDASVGTGTLYMVTRDSSSNLAPSTVRLGATIESGGAIGNSVFLMADSCNLENTLLCGQVLLGNVLDCRFKGADPGIDPSDGSSGYSGNVSMSPGGTHLGLVSVAWADAALTFGQTGGAPYALKCDSVSRRSILDKSVTWLGTWSGGDNADGHFVSSESAEGVHVDASGFSGGALDTDDDNVQVCLEALTNIGDYSSIYDPVSFTVSLLPSQSGCLHNTENSTAGKSDPHVVTLPTPAVGLCYTIARAKDIPLYVQVDNDLTEQMRVVGAYTTTVTKIMLLNGAVKVVAISSTEWLLFIEGVVQLDPDTSDTEFEYSEGLLTISRGSAGDSNNGIPQIKGTDNQSLMGNISWGQMGMAIGAQAEHIGHSAFSTGAYGRARENWTGVHVAGGQLDFITGQDPGEAQSTFGCKFVGKSVSGATDITGALIDTGGNGGIYLDNNTIFKMRGQVVAKCLNHQYACKTWEYELTVACDNSGNGTLLSSTITDTSETAYMNESTWTISFQTTTPAVGQDQISMVCVGESGRDVYFVGSIETSEVSVYIPS